MSKPYKEDTIEEIMRKELLFELAEVPSDEYREYSKILENIYKFLKRNRSLREIKKKIYASKLRQVLRVSLMKVLRAQAKKLGLSELPKNILVDSLTRTEVVRERAENVARRLLRFAAYNKENVTGEAIAQERKSFQSNSGMFMKHRTKQYREGMYQKREDSDSTIKGWMSIAVIDSKTSAICLSFANKFYSKEIYKNRRNVPNKPPRHPHCRSVLVPVHKSAQIEKYKPESVDSFLRRDTKAGQQIMGKKRYNTYKQTGKPFMSFMNLKTMKLKTQRRKK